MGIDLPTHLQSAAGEQGRKGYAPEEKRCWIALYLCGIFVISAIAAGIIFICRNHGEENNAITPGGELAMSDVPASEEIYADILDVFYYNIQNGWAEYNKRISLYGYGGEVCFLFLRSFSDPSFIDSIGYSFIDFNGDGIDELLIGVDTEEEYQNIIYDLYTYMDGQIIHLATSGERFFYQLCEDNTIYYFGSGGAYVNLYYRYQLDLNEPVLSIVEGVYSEPDENQDICWYHSIFGIYNPETHSWEREEPVVISEDEATVIRDSWPRRADFPLTYFSEYTPDGNQNQNLTIQDILEK